MSVIKFPSYTAREVLEERLENADQMRQVIVLELRQDGTRYLAVSQGELADACILKCMFDSWLAERFRCCDNIETPKGI